jgi:hypothetical protein
MIPTSTRHCERSEAIQKKNWIAASPSAPRNDEEKNGSG